VEFLNHLSNLFIIAMGKGGSKLHKEEIKEIAGVTSYTPEQIEAVCKDFYASCPSGKSLFFMVKQGQ